MNMSRIFRYCATLTGFVLAGFLVSANPTFAQEANDEQTAEVIEEVVKMEAQIERHFVGHRSALGTRTEVLEIRQAVSFADLDLSKGTDVTKLNARIKGAAEELCDEIADRHPIPVWGKDDLRRCVRDAIESTDDELEAIIAAL